MEEYVARWEEFFDEEGFGPQITALADAYPEERSLVVEYGVLDRFDTDLALYLLEHPQNAQYTAERALQRFVPPTEEAEIRFRVRGFPRDLRTEIRALRAKHLGKLVSVEGLVRKATEVRPRLVEAVFQCLRCGAVIKEAQEGLNYREPLECYEDQGGCSRTASATKWKLLDEGSRYIDTQKLEIQEPPEELRGGEAPQRLVAYVEDDLTGYVNPGDRVVLNGVLRGSQRGRFSAKSTLFDIFVDANSAEMEQVEYEEIEITPEDEARIREEAGSGDVIRKIVGSIAPSIYGMTVEKEALALQLFGGIPKSLPDGRRIRGDSHVLLIGDPGVAKSELLAYMTKLSPRGIYASGKASTAGGLTAIATKDEFGEGRWTLEAGALVLADKGLACLHPDSQVLVDGDFVPVRTLFDEKVSRKGMSRGRELEIAPLAREVLSVDTVTGQTKLTRSTLAVRRRYRGSILRVTLASGAQLRLTPDHLVLDGGTREWRALQGFQPGSSLVTSPQPVQTGQSASRSLLLAGTVHETVVDVQAEPYEGYVYDLRVPETENFLCDGAFIHNCIDEIEKMSEQDRSAIHTAMEQQAVYIAKAGITATLQTRCAILAAGNPTLGRFDENKYISEQINLPPTLLSVDGQEPLLVREGGVVQSTTIGSLVDRYYGDGEGGHPVSLPNGDLEVPAFDPSDFTIAWAPVRYVFRHRIDERLYRVELDTGRTLRLTAGHSIYVFREGKVTTKPTSDVRPGDYVVVPGRLPANTTSVPAEFNLVDELGELSPDLVRTVYLHNVPREACQRIRNELPPERRYWATRRTLPLALAHLLKPDEAAKCTLANWGGGAEVPATVPVDERLLRFLGYYIAEGSLTISSSSSYMISLSFNKKEKDYIEDVRSICEGLFGIVPRLSPDKGSTKVVISNKVLFLFLARVLKLPRGARKKQVPDLVFNVPRKLQKEFLIGYLRGDRGVTVSRQLISDVLYLLLQSDIVGSAYRTKEHTVVFPDGHKAKSSGYLLVSPSPYRESRLQNRDRHRLAPYREATPILGNILGPGFEGGYGKPCKDPRLGPHLAKELLGRRNVRERIRRLRLLRQPMTTTVASDLFGTTSHGEHARAYLQRLFRQGLVEKRRLSGEGKPFSWRYVYRLSDRGERVLSDVSRLNRLMRGDLAFARVKSVRRVKATGEYVYDLSTPLRENFVAGFGGVICHNSRFDAIFPILDKPQAQYDQAMAEHILKAHLVGEHARRAEAEHRIPEPSEIDEAFRPYLDPPFLRKYVAFAKRIYPVLTDEAMEILKDKYLEIRKQGEGDGGTVPITPRQLEAFIRLAEASARARLSPVVEAEDAKRSVRIIEYWLKKVTGLEGGFDIDIVATGVSSSQRAQMVALREIIAELSERDGSADLRDILEMADERGIPGSRVEAWLRRWSQEGEVYSPAANKWKLVSRY